MRLLIFLLLLLAPPVWGADYYVSQAGAGVGNGLSPETAMSLANFNSAQLGESAGDTVYFLGAFTGVIGAHAGASTSSRITYRGDYPGNPYTVSESFAGDPWLMYVNSYNAITGFNINIPSAVNANGFYLGAAITGVYIYGITIQTNDSIAISSDGSSNIFSGNIINDGQIGITIAGDSNFVGYNRVENQTSTGIYLSGADSNTVIGNSLLNAPNIGIYLENSDSNTISRNSISDIWNDLYYGGGGNGYGIVLGGSSEQNTIRYNTIFENLGGIVLQCDSGADLNVVEFNIIYSNYVNGISVLNDGNSGFNHIRHNTIFHSPSGSNTPAYVGHGIAIEGGKRVYISNNLIVNYINDSDSHGVLLVTTDAVQIRIDNNLIYCPNGGYIGGSSTDLATWKSDNQTDAKITNLSGVSAEASANDISSDPLLTATYGLQGNSPAKDAGAVLYTYAAHPGDFYNRKIYGAGPDIGAIEYEDHTPGGWFFEMFIPTIMQLCASTNAACYTQE